MFKMEARSVKIYKLFKMDLLDAVLYYRILLGAMFDTDDILFKLKNSFVDVDMFTRKYRLFPPKETEYAKVEIVINDSREYRLRVEFITTSDQRER